MKNILLVASKSPSRQMLLKESGISYQIIEQNADESACEWGMTLQAVVENIALHKMQSVILPDSKEGDSAYVMTADTMSCDSHGKISGKPISREDAIEKIKAAREGARIGTAFCLDKRIFRDGTWSLEKRIQRYVSSEYFFVVPDNWIDRYLEYSVGFRASGAIAIEGYGSQFLQKINGSYSAIVGLPMYELREALDELNFFD